MGEEILISFTSSYHSTLNIPHSEPHKKNAIYAKTNKVSSSDTHSSHQVSIFCLHWPACVLSKISHFRNERVLEISCLDTLLT